MINSDTKYSVLFLVMISLVVFGGLFFIYRDSNTEKKPIKYGEWHRNVETLKQELKQIQLPPETEIEEFSDGSKRGQTVFLSVRYKTQMPVKQFLFHMEKELRKNDWSYYDKIDKAFKFCRGKSEAALYDWGDGGIFSEKGNNFILIFMSSFDGINNVSYVCR